MATFVQALISAMTQNKQKTALVDCGGSRKTTFAELLKKVYCVAGYLKAQNIPEHSFICISLPKDADYFACEIGCWFAGHAIVPMGDTFPQQRVDYITNHCQAAMVLDASHLDAISKAEPCYEPAATAEDTLAAVFYTSGSTGNPKGVMHTFGSLMAGAARIIKSMEMTGDDVFSTGAPMYFMASIFDFSALIAGASVHVYSDEVKTNINLMEAYIRKHNVTASFMSPTVVSQYTHPSPSLRIILAASERLSGVAPTDFNLCNGYGQTETAGIVTIFKVDKKYDNTPIGRVMDDVEYCILDEEGNAVAKGEEGELCLKGVLTPGYFRDEERTAQLWQNGWMHTGDLVKELEGGNLLYVNRKDWMVKINGQRVEPGEVEEIIKHQPGVKGAIVKGFQNRQGKSYLVAYYTLENEANVDDEQVAAYIRQYAPEYMVPSYFVKMDEFPLNQNGKQDRKALKSPVEQTSTDGAKENLNVLEQELHDIIADVIGIDDFLTTDSLAYLGLTSITSIKLATVLYKKYGIEVKPRELAKNGTLKSIENAILDNMMNKGESGTTDNVKHATAVPLTFAQTGVYYDIVRTPGSTSYNMPFVYAFPEGVTAEMLAKAAKEVLAAHVILGTHFEIQGTEVVQVYPDHYEPEVQMLTAETEETFQALKADFVKPFNPAAGPLYRIQIVTFGKKVYMFMDTLHLVMDGASVSLFMQQLTDALEGKAPEAEHYTYFDYADAEQHLPETQEYAASEQYFCDILKTVDGVSNITEDLKPQEGAEARLAFAESVVDNEKISDMAKKLGITPANIFLAAAYYTVSRYTNTQDVCFCTISNGRSNLRISDSLGMFVNTITIASHINDCSVQDYILKTAKDFNAALEHENYPFAKIAEKFDLTPTLFFQYQVGVLNNLKVKLPGNADYAAIEREEFEDNKPKFKFIISIEPKANGGVVIQIQYDDTLYSPELAQGFADAMATALANMVAEPEAALKSVSMLSAEQAALISTFHETKRADVPVQLYHKLFEASVEAHKDDLALVALNPYTGIYDSFTFSKLNENMNRIAHSLINRGVKTGDRIALLLPRTSRLIMSQYGVLKAGGAYIPCDPKYPTERINLILEDSESKYIITTRDRLEEFPGKAIDVEELLNSDDKGNPNVEVTPDDLAYLIYTSGSTGRPKGVQLMHKGVCNYHHQDNIIQSCLKNECHAALGITTISFDMSVWETGSPLMLGKTLVFVGDDDCNDPNRLAWLLDTYGVDCMTATTSRFMQLLESPAFEETFARHIHLAYQGGEGLSMALLRKLQSYPNVRIFNGYGPTETIANSHASELTNDNLPHIGKPCVNYSNYIIDNDGNELPVGVVGELVIGGNSVAKGYNNLPEQTASKFIECTITNGRLLPTEVTTPSAPSGEEGREEGAVRLYKSGDYARWLPDGNVMVLGRKDNQVKLRGLRIELGEVESAITKVEGVKNVAVMIKKLAGKDHLCAYFTADRQIEIDDMKAEISQTLTHYMVPSAYLQMEAFPLTPNGKTDVKHLPEPVLAKVGGNYVAPKNKAEEDFCSIFGKILDLEKVSAADSFFELGGSSLTATRVVIEATNMGYTISYSDVFNNPTAQKMAAFINGDENMDESIDTELTDYDYSQIDSLLAENTLDSFRKGERQEMGDVLLTGANGYLGIHILHELLENHLSQHPEYKVYCLVRHGKNGVTSENRLRNLLFYYFEKNYKDMFGKQIIVIDGDVTSKSAFDELEQSIVTTPLAPSGERGREKGAFTLINCAAIVKHFSDGTEIEDINIGGLQNCVDFCLKTGARLIQTSTNSTAGEYASDKPEANIAYSEQMHFIGQSLTSKYTHSKFIAERIVLEAIINKGLNAKVVRLGNLSPRVTDGEFQINFRSNSSMGRLHIFQMLGAISYSSASSTMEFSPIDEVAHAIILLASTPKECVIFHPVNNHSIILGDVVREMSQTLGTDITEIEDEDFQALVQEAGQDPEKAKILQSMLAYAKGKSNMVYLQADNSYTNSILARLGFHWNVTSWDYVARFIKAIAAMNFFEDKR